MPGAGAQWRALQVQSVSWVDSLAVLEAMDMASKNGGPLQEELVLVSAWLVKIGVLQAEAMKLRGPEREVWRVGFGIADGTVDVLGKVKEESGIEAPRQSSFQIAVQAPGVTAPEGRVRGR